MAARFRPWLWMADPDQLDDLASDMSVFHGIRDIGAMRSPALARLAARIGAYRGAVAAPPPAVPLSVTAPQAPGVARRRDPGPVASADQLRRLLAPAPGASGVWGVVRQVKAGPGPQGESAKPDEG